MKLVTVARTPLGAPGCVVGGEVLDFGLAADALPVAAEAPDSVAAIIDMSGDGLAAVNRILDALASVSNEVRGTLRRRGALRPLDEVRLMAPLPRPKILFLHGQAYHGHVQDWDPNAPREKPDHPPAGFIKALHSITGPFDPIQIPAAAPDYIDYEGELCVVFGRRCFGVTRQEAMDYVAGYTILNDVSARDWTRAEAQSHTFVHARPALNMIYKSFPTFCPIGPYVTTKDEIPDHRSLRLVTRLNGEVMQDAILSDLIWDIPDLIESYSKSIPFEPGDILSTGTPGGVGAGRNPPVFMKAGDTISVSVEGVGEIRNPVTGP